MKLWEGMGQAGGYGGQMSLTTTSKGADIEAGMRTMQSYVVDVIKEIKKHPQHTKLDITAIKRIAARHYSKGAPIQTAVNAILRSENV